MSMFSYIPRYSTIRTRVGRYLKSIRPSGSGTDDFTPSPEYKKLAWLFPYIKARNTISSLTGNNRAIEIEEDLSRTAQIMNQVGNVGNSNNSSFNYKQSIATLVNH